jgi:hypothetical protein
VEAQQEAFGRGFWLLEFLEISGVGKIVEVGAGEEERRAAGLDGWIA